MLSRTGKELEPVVGPVGHAEAAVRDGTDAPRPVELSVPASLLPNHLRISELIGLRQFSEGKIQRRNFYQIFTSCRHDEFFIDFYENGRLSREFRYMNATNKISDDIKV